MLLILNTLVTLWDILGLPTVDTQGSCWLGFEILKNLDILLMINTLITGNLEEYIESADSRHPGELLAWNEILKKPSHTLDNQHIGNLGRI